MGFLVKKNEFRNAVVSIAAWKILYYSFALIMPLIMVNLPWWHILLAFLSMHFFTGLLVSLVFQVAHIMPSSEFPLPDEDGLIAGDWPTHQFATTANYSPRSNFFSWFIGGLNYQIEHHLFPRIAHSHYPRISEKVRPFVTSKGGQYIHFDTVWDNLSSVHKYLKRFSDPLFNPVVKGPSRPTPEEMGG